MEWGIREWGAVVTIGSVLIGNLIWMVWATSKWHSKLKELKETTARLDAKLNKLFGEKDKIEAREQAHFSDIRVAMMAFAMRTGNPDPDPTLVEIARTLGKKRNGG